MKKILMAIVGITLGIMCYAHDFVNIKGTVVDPEDKPIAGASVLVVGTRLSLITNEAGVFEARIPDYVNYLIVKKPLYFDQIIRTSYEDMKVVLVVDEAAKKAAEEKAAAAKAAAAKAAAEKAAAEKAMKDAAAKAAAEKAAAEKAAAEAARLAAEKAAEAQAAAEKAEAERLAAEKAAADAANAAAGRGDQDYDDEAERLAREAIDRDMKARRGIQHTISLSYLPFPVSIPYRVAGNTEVSPQPIQIDYTLGYRFSNSFAVGASVGYMRFLKSLALTGDDPVDANGTVIGTTFSAVPICLNGKYSFGNGSIHPFVSASAGFDVLSSTTVFDAGLGIEIRKDYRSGFQFMVGGTKLPVFGTYTPKFKIGYMF